MVYLFGCIIDVHSHSAIATAYSVSETPAISSNTQATKFQRKSRG